MTKNQMRRAKKKEQKKAQAEVCPPYRQQDDADAPTNTLQADASKPEPETTEPEPEVETADKKDEPAAEPIKIEPPPHDEFDEDPAFAAYKDIFGKFGLSLEENDIAREANAGNKGELLTGDDDDIPDDADEESAAPKLSKKKRKALNKLSVAELKALVRIPEVVEWQDVSSSDPRLLVQIKAQRNVVPVPTHWSLKREYLSSKRGIEKSAFRLPQFIAETGITEMRDAVLEKQAEQTLKQKQRERVAPKMGRLDIDYQRLYDAFFRFQTKPELTRFGEVYYEGKESEVDYQHFRPGELSDAVKEALGMPPGAPPPWLINQQRIGTPPSYPTLKIPGLNAPPPSSGSWGFHPGGWGKPPVDDYNRPLYGGDVFGIAGPDGSGAGQAQAQQPAKPDGPPAIVEPVDRTLWGELQPRAAEEESEEEEDSDEEEDEDEDDEDGAHLPGGTDTPSGLETPAGIATSITDYGAESSAAGEMDLRKDRHRSGLETEENPHPRTAYQVLPERQVQATGFFGSGHGYDLSSRPAVPLDAQQQDARKRKKPGDVDVALDPEALDGMSKEEVARRYEESQRREGLGAKWQHDDSLSQMIAEESRKRQRTESERQEKRREGRYRF